MAIMIKASAAPSGLGGSLSSCSPNSYMNGAFQDSSFEICPQTPSAKVMCESRMSSRSPSVRLKIPKSNLRKLSIDCTNHTITTESCLLGSQSRPLLSGVDDNAQIENHDYRKKHAKHNYTESSLIVVEQNEWDMSKREVSNGITNYRALDRSSSRMRRRLPARLELPPTATSLEIVKVKKDMPNEINVEGSKYAVACKKGRKEVMEDTYTIMTDVSGDSSQAFFGVFDGHGGRDAAQFAAENLGRNIVGRIAEIREGCGYMADGVRSGYLTTDKAFTEQNLSSGTCCVTVIMKGGHMVVANAGDCRAVLSIQGNAEALTCDHKIEREDERQRIEHLGGYVDCYNGVWRVQGMLAVSRSIGDRHMKKWISAEPEIKTLKITLDSEFLILASDGLWDKVGNQDAVDIVRPFTVGNSTSSDVMAGCRELVEVAVRRGSIDDVTVMIVDLRNFCK